MRSTLFSAVLRRCRASALLCFCAPGILSCDGQHRAAGASNPSSSSHPAAVGAPSHAAPSAAKGPGLPTVNHTLMDAGWGLPYGTVKLPAGWAFNGGVVHGDTGCVAMGDSPMWSAESEDKSYGIVVLPMLKTGFTSDANIMRQMQQFHCPTLRSSSAADYLAQYILPHLHAAGSMHILSTGPEPQLAPMAEQFRQMAAQRVQVGNNQYSRMHATVETARVLVQFQQGGKTLNEVASTLFTCTDTQLSMPMMGRSETLDCSAPVTLIAHGPDDGTPFTNEAIDAHSKDPAFFTMTQNEAWTQRFNQKMQQVRQQQQQQFERARQQQQQQTQQILTQGQQNMRNQQAQFDAGQARYHAQQQSFDQQNAAWQARQQAQDQSHQAFNHYLSDTNVYTNTQTGQQYEMSNQYNNTYINQTGQVGLQTNSATSPGVDWTLLQPKY